MIDRREILGLTLATVIDAAIPGRACAAKRVDSPAARRFAALMASFTEEILHLSPASASWLGLDSGARAALKSRLDDRSPTGDGHWAAQVKSMLARLATFDPTQLSPIDQIRHATIRYAATGGSEGVRFFYGDAGTNFRQYQPVPSPYPVSQQDGAVSWVPDFLDTKHTVIERADAEAYLARVAAFARLLDQESARIAELAGRDVMPPNFIAANAMGQLTAYRRTPAANQKLVTSLVARARSKGIKGDWDGRVTKLVHSEVYPALDRQIAAFAKATAHAPDVAGVHRLPDGGAYYQWALKLNTTTDMSASEIHAVGLEQNEAIKAQMDAILRSQGMSQGTVGERVMSLNGDPRQLYPDTDVGRQAVIDYFSDRLATLRSLMPRFSHLRLEAPLICKPVPKDIQDGAPSAYMNPASLGNARPAIYYLNLKSIETWPKFYIPTTAAHEGIPGHAWQTAYLAEHYREIPLIAQLTFFSAFQEGWALYAEQVVDELGFYANDSFGQLGYLQQQQFRACRLVVDTGMHAMKWTREQAIRFFIAEIGYPRADSASEIDRYCAWPGQACSYKVGQIEILRQRERVRTALGAKFDLATFNDAVVKTGGVPLALLGTAVDQLLATK